MLQECQVQRCTDGILFVLREDNLPAVVALVQCGEDKLGIVGAVTMTAHMADLLARVAMWERSEWWLRSNGVVSRVKETLHCSPQGEDAHRGGEDA